MLSTSNSRSCNFTFSAKKVRYGDVYSVTVSAQPIPPMRTCVVTNGTGTVPDGDISNGKL